MKAPLDSLVGAYLHRLGVDREEPSAEAMQRLHRAHAERVPYETLWIHLREGWNVNPHESLERIVAQQRGGYCFHLNGAFHVLLEALGYQVERHVGSVSGPEGPTPDELANHLALTVQNVPSNDLSLDGLTWYVDLGLGDALHDATPLRIGDCSQEPMTLSLDDVGSRLWRLNHDPQRGSFTSMTFDTRPAQMSAFEARHYELATSPHSRFVRTVTVQRRDATGADILRGCVLQRVGQTADRTELLSADEWFGALREVFGLPLDHVSAIDREELWGRVWAKHEQWRSRQR
jgi:N-hydroxyarylamine O-acetyltransferase